MKRHAIGILALLTTLPLGAATTQVRLGHDVIPLRERLTMKLDPRADTYSGTAVIELDVRKPAKTFNLHAEEMKLDRVTIDGVPASSSNGPEATVDITPGKPLAPGHRTMTIEFSNEYDRRAIGLYKMVREGEPYLFTQFESIDARKAFPCWDEPGFKIPFSLTASIPSQYEIVFNTPVAKQTVKDGWKIVTFAETKPLPSYLVALAVGALEFTPVPGTSIPTRIVTVKGESALTGVSVEQTPRVLAGLEQYFGTKYPFEKLDLIGVPEYWYGAMENPGLITFAEDILLMDPKSATPGQRRMNARITTHEIAHMWFGDLVTMQWWDDMWLNESFADWMGDKVANNVYPEYGISTNELQNVQHFMDVDASPLTAPIHDPDATPDSAMRAVGVAYNKGKAVIAMFERWLGEDEFRKGVQRHLKAHAWGNAKAGDFWAALGKGTAAPMETFISQPGIPLVTAEIVGTNEVRLSQKRYLRAGINAADEQWIIPVALRYSDGSSSKVTTLLLDAPSKTFKLGTSNLKWVLPRADAIGYYRWNEPAAQFATLSAATSALSVNEKIAYLGNLSALLDAGVLHSAAYLDALQHFSSESDPQVLGAMMSAVGKVGDVLSDADRPLFQAYVARVLGPVLERIGYSRKADEAPTVTMLRPRLLAWVANGGADPKAIAFGQDLARKYMKDPASVDRTLANAALGTLAYNGGDAALFEEFRKRFESATVPSERNLYLSALGSFKSPELRTKALAYALSESLRPNEIFSIPFGYMNTDAGRNEVFAWALANYDSVIAKRMPAGFRGGIPRIAGGCNPELLSKARAFFLTPERRVDGMEQEMTRTEESVNECVAFRAREGSELRQYLQGLN